MNVGKGSYPDSGKIASVSLRARDPALFEEPPKRFRSRAGRGERRRPGTRQQRRLHRGLSGVRILDFHNKKTNPEGRPRPVTGCSHRPPPHRPGLSAGREPRGEKGNSYGQNNRARGSWRKLSRENPTSAMKPPSSVFIAPLLVNFFSSHTTAVAETNESPLHRFAPCGPTLSVPKRAVGGRRPQHRETCDRTQIGQSARVHRDHREDDHGARWEVEITSAFRPGIRCLHQCRRKSREHRPQGLGLFALRTPGRTPPPSPSPAFAKSAASAARVTGNSREDDYGATWEVEVNQKRRFEYDVYVDAAGGIVRIKKSDLAGSLNPRGGNSARGGGIPGPGARIDSRVFLIRLASG